MEIKSVKIQGEGYLLNGTMSVPQANGNREYELIKEWLAQGNVPEPEFTKEELAQQELEVKIAEAKAEIARQLETLTVTTANGNTFDADNQARLDMQNAITASDFLGITQTTWRMADASEVLIELSELKEALALAIQEYARVKGIGA